MTKKVASLDATEGEKRLVEEFHPLPLSNEESWAIARKHLGTLEKECEELRLAFRITKLANNSLETRIKTAVSVIDSEPVDVFTIREILAPKGDEP